MKVVYTQVIYKKGEETGRYYYGLYEADKANNIADELNAIGYAGIYYCVCDAEDAKELKIQNLPFSLR